MSSPQAPASPLHAAAAARFPHASLRGLMTFAPPSTLSLLDLLEDNTGILVAINAEKIARADAAGVALTAANLGYPDGIGAVLALRRVGIAAHRMPGAEVWLEIFDRFAAQRSFYLIGGQEEVVRDVAGRLQERTPGVRLWYRNGYMTDAEQDDLLADVRRRQPDFVFVAMGSPQQELLMRRLDAAHPAVYMGLGGSFDIFVGRTSRAPVWLRRAGLEGAYRVLTQPTRFRRVPALMRFVALLGAGRL
ncbi:MAG: WecB/TagA/CpsF family glycosyltransferase [Chloroflexota bacterium]|nr:WecB/TagA/CpsF family glycosyltransferase [Chloroflexota bacterium]